MKFGVITFPGSNGEHDALSSIEYGLEEEVVPIWHKELSVDGFDVLLLPGGFSYGDYLRAGAIARFSPVMEAVAEFALNGGPILGMCNGFQVLTEAGLLPGALLGNDTLRFSCRWVHVRIETDRTPFTYGLDPGSILRLPIAHGEGRYYASPKTLAEIETNNQVVFRYTNAYGDTSPESNPNGSLKAIAGVCNERGNVVGLMPHPERAYDALLGGDDGLKMLGAVLKSGVEMAVGG